MDSRREGRADHGILGVGAIAEAIALRTSPRGFESLAEDYATPGGLNEQFAAALALRGRSSSSALRSTTSSHD